ncbi:hypothetical protein M011DRAFT_207452 [Sporormia fimetaria CBS 119925]|uniref:RING-type domain-containing protein n=1 Tax=Sporormia fimetaria CBS 119925 TaxID=1340428 RepID=A0A6A6V0C9_9PLEO|nr:hypothetical protein M011DRAFT_207452 [Sporormia fimetaria CBS 119925]
MAPTASVLDGRDTYRGRVNRRKLTPQAVGFIVAIFGLLLVATISSIFMMRRRRAMHTYRVELTLQSLRKPPPPPPERREEARKKLEAVTEVLSASGQDKACADAEKSAKEFRSSMSLHEKECTICLSPLYVSSLPESAKVVKEQSTDAEAAFTLDATVSGPEEILRLKVCRHEFHAECLTSWFVVRKYSCPLCRAVYYEDEASRTANEGQEERTEDSPQQNADANNPR